MTTTVPAGTSCCDALDGPLSDEFALELTDPGEESKEESSLRSSCIKPRFLHRLDLCSGLPNLPDDTEKISDRSAQS